MTAKFFTKHSTRQAYNCYFVAFSQFSCILHNYIPSIEKTILLFIRTLLTFKFLLYITMFLFGNQLKTVNRTFRFHFVTAAFKVQFDNIWHHRIFLTFFRQKSCPVLFPIVFRLCVTHEINSCHFISSISSSIFTNPYFSYNGRPISVASKVICDTPCFLISFTSKSNV